MGTTPDFVKWPKRGRQYTIWAHYPGKVQWTLAVFTVCVFVKFKSKLFHR